MYKEEFFKSVSSKVKTIEGINAIMTNSVEHEVGMGAYQDDVEQSFRRATNPQTGRRGYATSEAIDDGNGWNEDLHEDGFFLTEEGERLYSRVINGVIYRRLEISQSPISQTSFGNIVSEQIARLKILENAASMVHMGGGSTHCHTSFAYYAGTFDDARNPYDNFEQITFVDVDNKKMYREIAKFIIRFMPVMKWLSMTSPYGARGAHGNNYDKLDGDRLFRWYDMLNSWRGETHTEDTDRHLRNMERESYMRVYGSDSSSKHMHWENRMLDCCVSPTHIATWMVLNRAITLFAYDMVRNGIEWNITEGQVQESRQQAGNHRNGWKAVDKDYIVKNYTEMKSLLVKYFKKMDSMDAIEVMDKLIDHPIPEYLEKTKMPYAYNAVEIEKYFVVRNRERDDTLRKNYLHSIKAMAVPMADNLANFHENIANHLNIQAKQAVSLYQMFKREHVEIDFMEGRILYMGD